MKKIRKSKKGVQLSTMLIGMLFTIGITALMYTWIFDGVNQYSASPPSNYNDSYYKVKGIYGNLSNDFNSTFDQLNTINSNTANQGVTTVVLSFVDFFFNAAYRAAKVALGSVVSIFTLIDVSISGLPLGGDTNLIKGLAYLSILFIAIIAILMRFVFKSGAE